MMMIHNPPNDQRPAMMMMMIHHRPNVQWPAMMTILSTILQVVYREPRLDTGPKSVGLFDQTKPKVEEILGTNGANL